jgi:hypothetical protein
VGSYDEPRIAQLLSSLPPPPEGWVRAAQELPLARRGLDDLVRRATDDAAFRRRLIDDLERTLRTEGVEPDRALVDAIRRRLGAA